MEIVVQNGDTGQEILRFATPQDGTDILEMLQLETGHHGVLKNEAGLVYTRSNKGLPPGTYTYHMPARESTDVGPPSWKMRLLAVSVALIVLGVIPQVLIMTSFMLRCGYHWNCSFSHFRGFINYIDGPFKIITFSSAIHGAWHHPYRWIRRPRHPKTKTLQTPEGKKGVHHNGVVTEGVGAESKSAREGKSKTQ